MNQRAKRILALVARRSDPRFTEMQATLLEYEHALQHIAEPHVGQCIYCADLARSALAGDNRAGFRQAAES